MREFKFSFQLKMIWVSSYVYFFTRGGFLCYGIPKEDLENTQILPKRLVKIFLSYWIFKASVRTFETDI